jgi:hypothetical protein
MKNYAITLITATGRYVFKVSAASRGLAVRAALGESQLPHSEFAIIFKVLA